MLYKKGSADDPANYRCITLLNHVFKIFSRIMLVRLISQCDDFLQDWQAGFRKDRGCRDNTTILRTLCQDILRQGQALTINFVDYAAAFDSVSHKFLDKALEKAGASNKMRAMARAVYAAAAAFTTVPDADGKCIKTDVFAIRRGVLQGDIMSPLFFILALEYILRLHDNTQGKGVTLSSTPPTRISTLGYADDLALTDYGDVSGTNKATSRVSEISAGSREEADMKVKIVKTKILHVRPQDPVSDTSKEEAAKVCRFVCPHLNCGFRFLTKHGMLVHAGRCEWSNEYEVERILACKGPTCARKYRIRWKNYQEEDDTWGPRANLHPTAIKEFEVENNLYVDSWPHRCPVCDLPCNSDRGVKIHVAKSHGKFDMTTEPQQSFKNSLADKAVREQKLAAQQELRPTIFCEGKALDNVFKFGYLGNIFAADGLQEYDIRTRIGMAMTRCGKLSHMFDSPALGPWLKVRLYTVAVVSLLTYGCESWNLTDDVMRKLNGANSQMLSRITGNDIRTEARPATSSFDIVKHIRVRRLRWLGQILRGHQGRLLFKAIEAQHAMRNPGSLFMDAPPHVDLQDLVNQSYDKTFWKSLESFIPSHLRGVTIYTV